MRKHLSFVIALFCCLFVSGSGATGLDSLGVVNQLKEVDVVSNIADKPVESTSPMSRIDAAQMRRTGITDVSDAVHRLPGVTLRDYGGAGGLKTVSVRGFGAAHTAVLYDGVAQTDAQTGQIDISRYSIDNLSALSLVIGDNEDIFVPARTAAAVAKLSINTIPVNQSASKLVAQLRAGAWGYVNPFLRLEMPIGENVSTSLVGEFTHVDNDYPFQLKNGDITTTERRTNSRMNTGHAEANFAWQIAPGSWLTAKAYGYDNSRRLPGPVVYYNNTSNEALKESNAFFQSSYRNVLSSMFSMMLNAKFNYSSSFYSDQSGKYPDGKLQQDYWQREYYASGALLCTPVSNWAFDYSIDYAFNNLNSNLAKNPRPFRHSVLQSATAKYKVRAFTAMARLLYSAFLNGAKEGIAAKDASRLSPSASLSVKPISTENLFFRLSYKNIFRMPTFSEAYFDHYGSEEILPESTNQINVGATYSRSPALFLQHVSASIDAYVNEVKDMIVAVPYNMFIWRMTNLGKVRVVGVDATLDAELAVAHRHTVFLSANYSFQRAMPRTNRESSDWMKQVAYIPVHTGNFSVSWENPWANVSFNGSLVGERFTSSNNTPATRIPAYSDMGVSAWREFQLKRCKIELRANALNIFNSQYQIIANYPMPGRSWQAAIKFTI